MPRLMCLEDVRSTYHDGFSESSKISEFSKLPRTSNSVYGFMELRFYYLMFNEGFLCLTTLDIKDLKKNRYAIFTIFLLLSCHQHSNLILASENGRMCMGGWLFPRLPANYKHCDVIEHKQYFESGWRQTWSSSFLLIIYWQMV